MLLPNSALSYFSYFYSEISCTGNESALAQCGIVRLVSGHNYCNHPLGVDCRSSTEMNGREKSMSILITAPEQSTFLLEWSLYLADFGIESIRLFNGSVESTKAGVGGVVVSMLGVNGVICIDTRDPLIIRLICKRLGFNGLTQRSFHCSKNLPNVHLGKIHHWPLAMTSVIRHCARN